MSHPTTPSSPEASRGREGEAGGPGKPLSCRGRGQPLAGGPAPRPPPGAVLGGGLPDRNRAHLTAYSLDASPGINQASTHMHGWASSR